MHVRSSWQHSPCRQWPGVQHIVLLYLPTAPSLSTTVFVDLPVSTYNKEKHWEQAVECCVCLEDFEEGEHMLVLPCKHFFHAACITQWFQGKNYCPLCKQVVTSANSCIIGSTSDALQSVGAGDGTELTRLNRRGEEVNGELLPVLDGEQQEDETQSGTNTLSTGGAMRHWSVSLWNGTFFITLSKSER